MKARTALALLGSLLAAATAQAGDPGYYLVTVYDNAGQRSVDVRYWTVQSPGRPLTTWPEVGLGWNVHARWYTEVFASGIYARPDGTRLSSWNWQNDFLLTQGQYPVDVALHTLLYRAHDRAEGQGVEIGPALQTDVGRTQLNFNVFFDHPYGAARPQRTQLKIQWQAKYRFRSGIHLGLQGFGELGPWNDWLPRERQSHRAGPALQMRWPRDGLPSWQLDTAYLWGRVYGGHGKMLSVRLQYLY